ncbi:MAG: FtsX-like permease family protein, partial [Clostridia bacterium]|nr:FtsX-like permease family protein [Clostridia bacterium]
NVVQVSVMDEDISISAGEVEALGDEQSVAAAAPYNSGRETAKNGISEMQVSVVGTTAEYARVKDYSLTDGRFISAIDVDEKTDAAVLGQTVALKLFGHTDVVGQRFMMKEREYTVVGVLAHAQQTIGENPNNQVIVPITTGSKLLGMGDIKQFSVLASSPDDIAAAKAQAQSLMSSKTKDVKKYRISSSDDLNEYMEESNKTMMALLGGIGGISLLVSGIGIMNIMLVSVRERTREIGIRKAVGAKRSDILVQFLVEAMALSAMGGVIGIGLTFALASPIGSLMEMTIVPSVGIVVISLVFSVIVGVVFGVYPAIKASKLRPVQALHYE